LHCVSSDSEDPIKDYEIIRKELGEYNKDLLKKEELILLTKSDLSKETDIKKIKTKLKKLDRKMIVTSIHDKDSLDLLLNILQEEK